MSDIIEFRYDPHGISRQTLQQDPDRFLREVNNFGHGNALVRRIVSLIPVKSYDGNGEHIRSGLGHGASTIIHAFKYTLDSVDLRNDIVTAAQRLDAPAPDKDGLESIARSASARHPEVSGLAMVAQTEFRRRTLVKEATKYVTLGAGLTLHQLDTAWSKVIAETEAKELADFDFDSLLPPLEDA